MEEREEGPRRRARRDLFPDDVRRDVGRHTRSLVAWPGIIRGLEFVPAGGQTEMRLALEHRYFDWIEGFPRFRELYSVSRRGEGRFRATVHLMAGSEPGMRRLLGLGDLAIVYGHPSAVRETVVELCDVEYLRTPLRRSWRDDVMD